MAFHAQLAEVARCLAQTVFGGTLESVPRTDILSRADDACDRLHQMLIEVPTSTALAPLYIGRAPELVGSRYRTDDQNALLGGNVGMLVCLLEEEECVQYGGSIELRMKATLDLGLHWEWLPIEDFGIPALEVLQQVVGTIQRARGSGVPVFVHCMAGLGRAGTLAAAILVDEGLNPTDSVGLVRWVRPGAIQSEEQENMIASLAVNFVVKR